MDIMVTGFGPFPHVRVNPTTTLARDVAAKLSRRGFSAKALILETSYSAGLPDLRRALAKKHPKAVLMLGLAARAHCVRVELFARGRASQLHPDVSGGTPAGSAGRASSLPHRSTGNAEAALASLRQAGIRARLSPSAGRYLCDASYALALSETNGSGVPIIFIHVPWLSPAPGQRPAWRVAAFRPRRTPLGSALTEIGAGLVRAGRLRHLETAHKLRHAA